MQFPKRLSKDQRSAKHALKKLLTNHSEADRRYDDLPDSHGGRVISTDIARFLDNRYRDTPAGHLRDLAPSWDLAWRYAQGRLERELAARKARKLVRFMAGGWGAGKTHALQNAAMPDLAWDGTLVDTKWALTAIELARTHGWRVEIAYVFRDVELAIYGAVARAKTEGRSVPLAELPANHRSVQLSVRHLLRQYGDDERIAFLLLHNTGAKGVRGSPLVFAHTELAPTGALHYSIRYDEYYAEAARQIQALNALEG